MTREDFWPSAVYVFQNIGKYVYDISKSISDIIALTFLSSHLLPCILEHLYNEK